MDENLKQKYLQAGELAKRSVEPENLAIYEKFNKALSDYLQNTGKTVGQISEEEIQVLLELVPGARDAMLDYWDGTTRFLQVFGVEDPGKKKKT